MNNFLLIKLGALLVAPCLSAVTTLSAPETSGASIQWHLSLDGNASAATVDGGGNCYVTGVGGQPASGAFVTKIATDGRVLWTSYLLGGDGKGVAVGGDGSVCIVGQTPGGIETPHGYDTTHNGTVDAFVAMYDRDGKLLWATYHGGKNSDSALAVTMNEDGSVFVTGLTSSPDFPAPQAAAVLTTPGAGCRAFVSRFSRDGKLLWSQLLDESSVTIPLRSTYGMSIASPGNGVAYLTGYTKSSDDVIGRFYVAAVAADGGLCWFKEVISGAQGLAIAATKSAIYAAGWTSVRLPKPAGISPRFNGGPFDAFVMKFDMQGEIVWSTYLGGRGVDHAYAVATDVAGNVAVAGSTSSENFPASSALVSSYRDKQDAFVAKLSPDGALAWSTYLGGSDWDRCQGVVLDATGAVVAVGYSYSSDFLAAGTPKPAVLGGKASFAVKIGTGTSGPLPERPSEPRKPGRKRKRNL